MTSDTPHIVVVGGGGGSVQVLRGLRSFTSNLTGIIAVTDTGRSTGKVRYLGNMPAPGDIRNGLGTLADEESVLAELIQYRLQIPHAEVLDGVAFGNLMLMGLLQMTGDFAEAIDLMRGLLGVEIPILPVTKVSTHICAELENGEIVEGEVNVRGLNKPPIKHIFLQNPEARAYEKCVEALLRADLIAIGPGSLFTTVLACLVFEDIARAIKESAAVRVFVCNTTTQPGQTDGYSLSEHVRQVTAHLGQGVIDIAVLNSSDPEPDVRAQYEADGLHPLALTDEQIEKIHAMGVRTVIRDVAEQNSAKRELWQKQDTIRHDPHKIAQVLLELVTKRP